MSERNDATGVCAKQVAYLAGPMRGYAAYNFPAFHAAAAKLRAHGLAVWSPAEHDVNEDGFDPAKDTAQPMKHYMKRDLPAVLDADMVCVLPGWEKSQGACLEVHVAQACGIPVYAAETMQPIGAQRSEIEPPSHTAGRQREADAQFIRGLAVGTEKVAIAAAYEYAADLLSKNTLVASAASAIEPQDIQGLRKRVAAAEDTLTALVVLKMSKDKYGKDADYEKQKATAWQNAKDLLRLVRKVEFEAIEGMFK